VSGNSAAPGRSAASGVVKTPTCSRSSASEDKRKTCFSHEELLEVARAYNRVIRGKPGALAIAKATAKATAGLGPVNIRGASTDSLVAQLKARLGPACENERCWLGLGILDGEAEKRLDLSFAPRMPESWKKNPTEWLSNEDIEEALRRHTARHADFLLMGVHPMDFMGRKRTGDCVSNLCTFSVRSDVISRGAKKAALVLNTDKHTGEGQHWVAVFIHACPDDSRYGCYYFDSTGRPPTPEVDEFASKVIDQLRDANGPTPEPLYAFNDNPLQRRNTECGVFCLHFIMRMLKRKAFHMVCSSMGDDVAMMRLRNKLFDPS
jgi:hypothetical protein